MEKSHLKATMLALTENELRQAVESYAEFFDLARVDRSDTVEFAEQAQARTAADLAGSFDDKIHGAERKLAQLRGIDFAARDSVAEGALVRLLDRTLVVAVSTAPFECAGQMFMGISTQAPIYAALAGKTAGERCDFDGWTLIVEEVC